MALNREHTACNRLNSKERECGQGQNRTADTRIFSPLAVAGLCVSIGRYWYLFKRLTAVSAGRFYRFEHIVAYSSDKVVAKSDGARPHIAREEQPFEVILFLEELFSVFDRRRERPRNFGVNIP